MTREFGELLKTVRIVGLQIIVLALLSACSIPNLQSPECTEAVNQVKKLYSDHFGNDMNPSVENLKLREDFFTKNLKKTLAGRSASKFDYITQTDDYPKAFRIGSCSSDESGLKAVIQVVLFWRDDNRSEQREISVETVKENGMWLVDKVEGNN